MCYVSKIMRIMRQCRISWSSRPATSLNVTAGLRETNFRRNSKTCDQNCKASGFKLSRTLDTERGVANMGLEMLCNFNIAMNTNLKEAWNIMDPM